MRGEIRRQSVIFSLERPGDRIRKDHPIRKVKWMVDVILKDLEPLMDEMYSDVGRPSIPPEWLLKSMVLMALFSVRSERAFCDRLDESLMFRFFLDMNMVGLLFLVGRKYRRRRAISHPPRASRLGQPAPRRGHTAGRQR